MATGIDCDAKALIDLCKQFNGQPRQTRIYRRIAWRSCGLMSSVKNSHYKSHYKSGSKWAWSSVSHSTHPSSFGDGSFQSDSQTRNSHEKMHKSVQKKLTLRHRTSSSAFAERSSCSLGLLAATYAVHFSLIWKLVKDFLLVIIELFR